MNLWHYIPELWRPGLEILILGALIYFAFVLVRGTRGFAVVTGFLGLLITLTLLTKLLQLTVLSSLLNQIFPFLAVAVVVLFQPELRRILGELGNLRTSNAIREQRENIEVVIQTVDRLAPVKIGALIAMEQTNHLADCVESGVTVDCEATPEMFETIFFPNNAIHDGGVLVKDGRILKAACIFPLTQRQDLHKSLGTRHRAAIGLSEETDAVIVVISEETGSISYAYKGELKRAVTIDELRAFLTQVFVQVQAPRGSWRWLRSLPAGRLDVRGSESPRRPWRWREFVQYNFGWKVAAVVLSTMIWLTVRFGERGPGTSLFSNTEARTLANIPVRVLTIASDASRFRVAPEKIEVILRGDASALRRIQSGDVEAYVNLADVQEAQSLQMRIHVYAPVGIRVESVQPPNARIEKLPEASEARPPNN